MKSQSPVLVAGSINVDCTVKVSALPNAGETIHGSDPVFLPGGKGGNQAVAVAAAGAQVLMIGAIGSDATGELAVESLTKSGIDTRGVSTKEGPTGTAFIFVEEAGENLIVVTPGANALIGADEVQDQISKFGGKNTLVLCQLELPLEIVERAAKVTHEMNGRFVLNLAPAIHVSESLLSACDPLIVNESEATLLTGNQVSSIQDAIELVQALASIARSAVITLGADGAVYSDGSKVVHVPGEKVDVVDTTGAGDAFVGALVAELSFGKTLDEAVAAGIVAGARAVQHFGAQPPK